MTDAPPDEPSGAAAADVRPGPATTPGDAAALAGAVLDLEADRRAEVDERPAVETAELPGVSEDLRLKDALRVGGTFTIVVLTLLNSLDELESAALGTLAPDIRDSLHVSNGTIVFIVTAASAFLVLGAVPMGWLADRFNRGRIIGIASFAFAGFVALSGLAVNAFMLFLTRMGVGMAKSNTLVVHGSLLADQYPIATRGRMNAITLTTGRVVGTISPLAVGAVAAIAGGPAGWRWAFIVLALPVAALAWLAFRLPEPPRGQFEKQDVLGEVVEEETPVPISMEATFARLLQIGTIRSAVFAFAALGFGLFTVPVVGNIFLEEEYGLGSFGRGAVAFVSGVAVLIALPLVGRAYDASYHKDPARALRLLAWLILPTALLTPIQFFMPNPVTFALWSIFPAVLLSSAFACVSPLLLTVVPYQLRAVGAALGSIYLFFIGAVGGALLSALLIDAYGPRLTITLIALPSSLAGGLLLLRGSTYIHGDLAMIVDELKEEKAELERLRADQENVPAVQVSHVDVAYGTVQVLFDVGFEVHRGETLALLGTNGAGKSTILRAIAGLGTPSRGAIRHHGRSITFVSPEQRTRLGLLLLPGGKSVFGDMTVRENLDMATWNHRKDRAGVERRIAASLELFPELAERQGQLASSLSGGEQQLLALAGVLACEPDVLMIDELSLGLAPVVVERLVGVMNQLREREMTIIVVEQSLNVAAAVADRAVFLEKGHVRFEGPIADLVARDDLVRAVFLGAEGG
ncbi:MAG: MFS transporter [Acidimicrobiales bacterium]|nr:MFS transporter [Acidimicrobiales bacterium]